MKTMYRISTRRPAGFTLIELMVTIMIGAILIAIAVPSYTMQTRKSRRTDAKTALLDLAGREERYNSTNSVYTSAPANLGFAGPWPMTVGGGYYQISVCVNAAVANCPGTDAGPTRARFDPGERHAMRVVYARQYRPAIGDGNLRGDTLRLLVTGLPASS
jgi:type IV pilus assembly protein PilE